MFVTLVKHEVIYVIRGAVLLENIENIACQTKHQLIQMIIVC